jgi:4-hydroxy-2-oxoheptanedioate aldolase
MQTNKIKQLWNEGKTVTLGWLAIADTFSAEVMARQGFDALCIDLQHGMTELGTLLPMLQAVSQTDTSPVVRVPANDPAVIMKALDLGAFSIIVPMINSAEEAAKAVSACRYPPRGTRSWGPTRAIHYAGADYLAKADEEMLVIGMVETKEGLANIDAICATPGLDAIYIGPSDLAFAIGLLPKPDNTDPLHLETCHRIRDAAHRHGKKACMHCASGAFAAGAAARGFDLVMLTSDILSLIGGVRKQLDDFKAGVKSAK